MQTEMTDTRWLADIERVGGHPALDFVNTVHSRVVPEPRDYLQTPAHLVSWLLAQELLEPHQARAFEKLGPRQGARLLQEARSLRETLYRVVSGAIEGKRKPDGLAEFNRWVDRLSVNRELAADKSGFHWQYQPSPERPVSVLAPLVFSAQELLLSSTLPTLECVKACPPPEGCGWLFLDCSRNRSRTWCSMKTCGNAAKVRRYRARRN